ncbi:MAG TPA: S41 family peptidase [Azospirillaceae bacterium]|nr:S41 family peptidase [Azospirillaceae bacterium]
MRRLLAALLLGSASLALAGAGSVTPFAAQAASLRSGQDDLYAALDRFSAEFDRSRVTTGRSAEDPHRTMALFQDVLGRVQTDYVRPMETRILVDNAITGLQKEARENKNRTDQSLVEAALDGMLGALDPYSSYLTPKDYRDMETQIRGQFGGLGVEVTLDKDSGLIKVVSPIDDTPASRAGLATGDLITHLDGDPVKGMNLNDAVARMRGPAGTQIRLTIQRSPVGAPFNVTLTRAVVKIQAVRWRVEGEVGYIRLTTFNNKQTAVEVQNAVTQIKRQLGGKLAGLVLDLRNNPGGLLDQAVAVGDLFLEKGTIVSIRGRKSADAQDYFATQGDIAWGLPIVLLTNGGSASASEIVAGALQDYRRAIVFGTRSYGKGSVQTITPLPDDGALRLTTARYLRPTQSYVDCFGVSPNVLVRSTRKSDPPEEEHQKGKQCEEAAPPEVAALAYRTEEVCPGVRLPPPAEREKEKTAAKADRPAASPDRDGKEDEYDAQLACAVEALRHHLQGRQ